MRGKEAGYRADVIFRWILIDQTSAGDRAFLETLLSEDERQAALALRFEEDRAAYVAAHALARALLAARTGRAARDWAFRAGLHGKPRPIARPGEPDIRLNLSHTRGLAAVALCVGREIGVDVEWMGQPAPFEVAEQIFAPAERDLLDAHRPDERPEVFYRLWTLKEAYLKATACGLARAPVSCVFALDPPRLLKSECDPDPARWHLRLYRIEAAYMASLAYDAGASSRISVSAAPADLARLRAASGN